MEHSASELMRAYHEHYTVEDYRQWEGDWELIQGMPYAMTPSPSIEHQRCVALLLQQLMNQLDEKAEGCKGCQALAEVDWVIARDTVVRPDVVLMCHEEKEQWIYSAPELVIEVVSPSSANRDENLKFDLYAREGVQWYLLVYPEEHRVRLYRNQEGRFVKTADAGKETVELDIGECRFSLTFRRLWRSDR